MKLYFAQVSRTRWYACFFPLPLTLLKSSLDNDNVIHWFKTPRSHPEKGKIHPLKFQCLTYFKKASGLFESDLRNDPWPSWVEYRWEKECLCSFWKVIECSVWAWPLWTPKMCAVGFHEFAGGSPLVTRSLERGSPLCAGSEQPAPWGDNWWSARRSYTSTKGC